MDNFHTTEMGAMKLHKACACSKYIRRKSWHQKNPEKAPMNLENETISQQYIFRKFSPYSATKKTTWQNLKCFVSKVRQKLW